MGSGQYQASSEDLKVALDLLRLPARPSQLTRKLRPSQSLSDVLLKRTTDSPRLNEAAYCYYYLYDLHTNHLHDREIAIFAARKLEVVALALNSPLWMCTSQVIACAAHVLHGSREMAITTGKTAVASLSQVDLDHCHLAFDNAIQQCRSFFALCSWRELEDSMFLCSSLMYPAVYRKKLMQSWYVRAVYECLMGSYRKAEEVLGNILSYVHDNPVETELAIRAHCCMVSVKVRLCQLNDAYAQFKSAALLFRSHIDSLRHMEDAKFQISAAGALVLTSQSRIDEAIPFLAICYRWCSADHLPLNIFQFVGLRQGIESTTNVLFAISGKGQGSPVPSRQRPNAHFDSTSTVYLECLTSVGTRSRRRPNSNRFAGRRMTVPRRSSISRPHMDSTGHRRFSVFDLFRGRAAPRGLSKSTLLTTEFNPRSLEVGMVRVWLVGLTEALSKATLDYGEMFRCFRPVGWLSRGVHKLTKASLGDEHSKAQAARCLLKSVQYSKNFRMKLEQVHALILLAWNLLRDEDEQATHKAEILTHLRQANRVIQTIPDEAYTSTQLNQLLDELSAAVGREGTLLDLIN
eukprot:c18981_g1_i1.p1 GENE.c18981_g1_i1~~c18981_g1_i1.p1  ORF type:complete len:576 (+),score=109.47 c18981_g1_i1:3-1730(+)